MLVNLSQTLTLAATHEAVWNLVREAKRLASVRGRPKALTIQRPRTP